LDDLFLVDLVVVVGPVACFLVLVGPWFGCGLFTVEGPCASFIGFLPFQNSTQKYLHADATAMHFIDLGRCFCKK
jgi:hypothetical protein